MSFTLSNSFVSVSLDQDSPLGREYTSVNGRSSIMGNSTQEVVVTYYDVARKEYAKSPLLWKAQADCRTAVYQGHLVVGSEDARINLAVSLKDTRICFTARLVSETPGIKVISLELPILSVKGDEKGASFAFPTRSGRLVDIAKSEPLEREHHVCWWDPIGVGAIGHDGLYALLTLDNLDDCFWSRISDSPKRGALTAELTFRHKADNVEVLFQHTERSSCSVEIVAPEAGKKADWTLAAKVAQNKVVPNLSDLYIGALVYKILLDDCSGTNILTFKGALDLVKRMHRLTNGRPQIVYLVGWQHTGHDTGYPDTSVINSRCGTLEEFREAIQEAKKYNAVISLHDNFHDAYMDSPKWSPDIVATDRKGELQKGGIWGGGRQAYIISPNRYKESAFARAKATKDMLGIETSVHLDVFTDSPDLIDFTPGNPASRKKNIEARLEIIREFRSLGLDMTSEIVSSPFLGEMSHYWLVERRPGNVWTSEQPIPFVSFVYHGKVTSGGTNNADEEMMEGLLQGWTFSTDFTVLSTDAELMDMNYLVTVPWSLYARKTMTGYSVEGNIRTARYGEASWVTINTATNEYEIVVDGQVVSKDFTTTAWEGQTLSIYSRKGGDIPFTLPSGWQVEALVVRSLEGKTAPAVSLVNGRALIRTEPRTPYWITVAQPGMGK
jgi:hypothetical protein